MKLSEAEKQLLIAVGWLRSRYGLMSGMNLESPATRENLRAFAYTWMGQYLVEWDDAYTSLIEEGLLLESGGELSLTEKGDEARKAVEVENPLWLYEYDNFFSRASTSRAHALFCERVYGRNLCQHGMADVYQLEKLLDVLRLAPWMRVLDLGCGNGLITAYLQESSGAFFEGVDLSEEAIRQARERHSSARERLNFRVGNMNRLDFVHGSFDAVVSIDTLYYVDNLEETLKQAAALLKPSGQMGLFFTEWISDLKDSDRLLPHNTGLATLLKKHGLSFNAIDLTEEERRHWRKKLETLEELKPEFELEGNIRLYDYRHSEAARYANWDSSKRSRYLYHVQL